MTLNEKIINFIMAIGNAYRDEESRVHIQQMKLDDNLTEDFTAIVFALKMFFKQTTGQEIDIIDFTHLLNKLVVQHLIESKEETEDE